MTMMIPAVGRKWRHTIFCVHAKKMVRQMQAANTDWTTRFIAPRSPFTSQEAALSSCPRVGVNYPRCVTD